MAWICWMAALMSTLRWAFRPGVVVWGRDRSWWRFDAELASVGPVEVEIAGFPLDAPASFVDQGVVMSAEEDQIVEAGRPTF